MEAVERHFRETHAGTIIKPVETHTLGGTACRILRCRDLARLARQAVEDQRRFPLQLATTLSQQFASHGLQFFKVNKTVTHVAVARPHFLDVEATPVSESIRRIVSYINAKPRCTHRQLVEALAPTPPVPPAPAADVAPVPAEAAAGESAAAAPTAPVEGATVAPPAPSAPQPTAAQTEVISDLHWLIHQGHVIEFASGVLETAKKPLPRPPKPEPKPSAKPAETAPASEAQPATEPPAAAESDAPPSPADIAPDPAAEPTAAPAVGDVPPAPAAESEPAPPASAPEEPSPASERPAAAGTEKPTESNSTPGTSGT
jgi:hypothetical protein